MKKFYIRGDENDSSKIIPTLVRLGGKINQNFTEEELSDSNNLFYVDYFENNYIKLVNSNTLIGNSILKHWKEINTLYELKELPKTLDEAYENFEGYRDYIDGKNPGLDKQMDYFGRIILLREIYRQGWIPMYNDQVYYIKYDLFREDLDIYKGTMTSKVLSFKTEECAREFLNNFRDIIVFVQEFI